MTTPNEIMISHAAACRAAKTQGADPPPLPSTNLTAADLRGADLQCAFLRHADLNGACLRGADLSVADLRGAYLGGADLGGANLYGARLHDADLRGADLNGALLWGAYLGGARVVEGSIVAHAAGLAGGYRWHALALDGGEVVLQYGCDRATLDEWRTRGPEYGARHRHPPEHWATGPAVAIAAAEALAAGTSA
jgi:hypothetical protein